MQRSILALFGVPVLLCIALTVQAQVTEDTYRRASFFLSGNLQKQVFHMDVSPNWLRDSAAFWHVTQTENGKRFFVTTISEKTTREAFDHNKVAHRLAEASGEKISSDDLPFSRIQPGIDGLIEFSWRGHRWSYDPDTDTLEKKEQLKVSSGTILSPDGRWEAFSKDHNLYVRDVWTGVEKRLSSDGTKELSYANRYGWSDLIKGEQGIRPENFHAVWSPDSKKLLTGIHDTRLAQKMFLLDYSQDDRYRPELYGYFRGSPGDTTVVYEIPVVFDLESGQKTILSYLKSPHFMPAQLRWDSKGDAVYGIYYHRGFKRFDIIEVDVFSWKMRVVHTEEQDTHIDYQHFFRKVGEDRFLLGSEKSGWRHLYLYDWQSGRQLQQITSGEYPVTDVVHVDSDRGLVYLMASGKERGRNPYYPHLYKVNMDGSGLKLLTEENAYHEVSLSPDSRYFVTNFSTIEQPTQSEVRLLEDGARWMRVSEADASRVFSRGYISPREFTAMGKDDETQLFGIYHIPSDFDPAKKYPVVNYSYTGPHTAIAPKTFKGALLGLQQSFAELGFVVVTVDGLGTAGRSKKFQDASYRNLGDGTTDHVLAIRQLAAKHTFLDLDRVGIFGHSAGGYDAARAMLLHPDFFKVGVSSAGNHDQRMEKAWWPEMYMGYPVGDFYEDQSNVRNAGNLTGRLLLAHGSMDENVNPSGTFKFIEALVKEGKDFDLFIWPSRNHSFGRTDGDYFTKKRWDYFIEHLMGEKPLLHHKLETE
jgi:dipeptidyl-peptidase-4